MITDFFCLLLKNTTRRISGYGNTGPHATKLGRIRLYCKRHFLAALFLAIAISPPAIWRPRPCDLTPLDFLCGYANDRAYADKPSTLEHLKTNIGQVLSEIPHNMCSQYFAWTSFKWHSVSHIMSRFKLYNKKRNIVKKKLYVCYLYLLLKLRNG